MENRQGSYSLALVITGEAPSTTPRLEAIASREQELVVYFLAAYSRIGGLSPAVERASLIALCCVQLAQLLTCPNGLTEHAPASSDTQLCSKVPTASPPPATTLGRRLHSPWPPHPPSSHSFATPYPPEAFPEAFSFVKKTEFYSPFPAPSIALGSIHNTVSFLRLFYNLVDINSLVV
ncbi:hypothetical protein GOP47_0000879 [Adiantum capillus-veneris]|uniref:Uncharacterized protein n=1 Tax=Adiantum capillus-veneris TaxID=13818 RepID=A0A9D4VES9_ADICA|nr:hypothetical protein GOP47_0000879 [Adiantum capillus-veneris]